MNRVLLVNVDESWQRAVRFELEPRGFDVDVVDTGIAAIAAGPAADVMVLNMELPDLDGMEVCRRIRARSDVRLIGVFRESTELDRVLALRAGLDVALEQSYGWRELVARIDAVTRRLQPRRAPARPVLSFGELEIDGRAREVRLSGRLVQLTRKEFDLLYLLASRGGATVDRREILSVVWHDDRAWLTRSRTVDTHVNSIRRKLDCNDIIRTQRGVGFRFDPEAAMNRVDDRVLTPV